MPKTFPFSILTQPDWESAIQRHDKIIGIFDNKINTNNNKSSDKQIEDNQILILLKATRTVHYCYTSRLRIYKMRKYFRMWYMFTANYAISCRVNYTKASAFEERTLRQSSKGDAWGRQDELRKLFCAAV